MNWQNWILMNELPGMLALPFVGKITGYAISHREWRISDEK